MVHIEWQMINPTFFFRYLKGRCHGNQFSGNNGTKLPTPALIALSFRNGMGYRNRNVCINSLSDAAILCSVTPEKTRLFCELFVRHGKKLAYLV